MTLLPEYIIQLNLKLIFYFSFSIYFNNAVSSEHLNLHIYIYSIYFNNAVSSEHLSLYIYSRV